MFSLHDPFEDDEKPTVRHTPSGQWIVSVDRASKRLEDAIARIEAGADPSDVLPELKEAHALVNGRAP
jgi:hypothetical protein